MTEFELLMQADQRLLLLEAKGYKVYQDKFGGIMVKGPAANVYNNMSEYRGANDGERIANQVESLYNDLGEPLTRT